MFQCGSICFRIQESPEEKPVARFQRDDCHSNRRIPPAPFALECHVGLRSGRTRTVEDGVQSAPESARNRPHGSPLCRSVWSDESVACQRHVPRVCTHHSHAVRCFVHPGQQSSDSVSSRCVWNQWNQSSAVV